MQAQEAETAGAVHQSDSRRDGEKANEANGRLRAVWAAGDYQRIAVNLTIMGELLCEAVDLRAGQKVLDVATGTGNTALAAARRNCEVTGLDFVGEFLERARQRAEAEGLPVEFIEGDAESLPFPDASFDVVLSTIGAMFVPDQQKAASELLRVCRPGGKIGMANWTPGSWAQQVGVICSRYVKAPPAGQASPFDWGSGTAVHALLGEGVADIKFQKRSFLARHGSCGDYWEMFLKGSGGLVALFDSLEPCHREAITAEVVALLERSNQSKDGTLVLPNEYLEVVATRRQIVC